MTVRFIKDPDATLDYTLDWVNRLQPDDSLVGCTFTPDDPSLIVISANVSANDASIVTRATGWMVGGNVGQTYNVTCHVLTAGGRQDDRTFKILIKET